MSSLENKTIAETYKDLLQISNNNSGADEVARPVEDGEGTQTALSLSTHNVGIGTDSPDQKLHVDGGDIKISSDLQTSNGDGLPSLLFSETTNNQIEACIVYNGDLESADDNYLGFGVYDVTNPLEDTLSEQKLRTSMNIIRNGNVGIGTTSPSYKLHIAGGTPAMKLEGTQPRIWLSETDQTDLNTLIRNSGSLFQIDTATDADDFVANRLTINHTTGNVGIGTTSPLAELHINGTVKATRAKLADLDIRSFTAETAGIIGDLLPASNTSHFGTIIETDPNGQMIFGIRGNDENDAFRILTKNYYNSTTDEASRPYNYSAFCVESNGNVGIGTDTPGSSLHVQSHPRVSAANGTVAHFVGDGPVAHLGLFENPDGQSLVQIKAKSDSYSILEMADAEDGNVGAIQYEHSNNNMRFKTNDSEKMRILSNGNVGIGTTTPSSPFEVSSTTGGVVLPRLTTAEMNFISNPTDGEMIYNTTEKKFYGHADGSWTPLH